MGGMSGMRMGAGSMPGMAAGQAGQGAAPAEPRLVDPKVKSICRDFGIDDDTCGKLHDAMKDREEFDEDVQALYKVMERATRGGKKPLEAMLTQIRAIKAGRFAGKDLLDADTWAFIEKYNLDDRVICRLIQTMKSRPGKRKETLRALDERLDNAQHPTQPSGLGLLVRLLEGLEETGRLPSPPRRLGGSGRFVATGTFLHPRGDNDGRDRPRSRPRRSRSRGRGYHSR